MAQVDVPLTRLGFGRTQRRDRWWVTPLVVFTILSGFIVYATWAAFQNAHYHFGNYLSPFYSPELLGDSPHAFFGPKPGWWPEWLPFSPALIILPFPALFRFTCYYYRGAYYKAFWADPVACAVGEPRTSYRGEAKLPLILQNVHRYFMYVAVVFLFFLAHDVYKAMWFMTDRAGIPFADGKAHFGIGVGTLVLGLNVALLSGYTLGCHSLRHLVGGYLDRFSSAKLRKKTYDCVSCLNRGHQRWAWMSLFGVMFADFYVRMLSMGVFTDWRII